MKKHSILLSVAIGVLFTSVAKAAPAFPTGPTGQKPQSKVWHAQGHWWAVLGAEKGLFLWKYVNGTLKPQRGPLPASHVTDACDVLTVGEELFILAHADKNQRLYKFLWKDDSYQLLEGFPVKLAIGGETSTLARDSTGRLWTATDRADGMQRQIVVTWSEDNHRKWNATGVILEEGVSADDICAIISFGKHVGVFWSDQVRDRFGFRVHQDGKPPAEWDATEIVSQDKGIADDHLHLAADEHGRVWAVTKDSRDRFTVWRRSTAGKWDLRLPFPQELGTRPIIVLSADQVIVPYTDWTTKPKPNPIGLRRSPMENPRFGPQKTILSGPTSWNNVSGPKHAVDARTGLLLIAGGSDRAIPYFLEIP